MFTCSPDESAGLADVIAAVQRRLEAKERKATAELELLAIFDARRQAAGYDYGAGQRGRELARLRRELDELRERCVRGGAYFDGEPSRDELADAFEAVLRPKLRRLEREGYRSDTPASRRTRDVLRRMARVYAASPATCSAV